MNILLIGSGGREHAIAWALQKSPNTDVLYVAPGNGGTAEIAENVDLDIADGEALLSFVHERNIGLVVIGPEAPLVDGVADLLRADGVPVFGPNADGAQLEGSKAYSKAFMEANALRRRGRRACLRARAGRSHRHQGRRSGGGQGRCGGRNCGRCRGCRARLLRRRLRRCRIHGGYRGVHDGPRVLASVLRHGRAVVPHGSGARPQARLRWRLGPQYRRHGRVLAGAHRDGRRAGRHA